MAGCVLEADREAMGCQVFIACGADWVCYMCASLLWCVLCYAVAHSLYSHSSEVDQKRKGKERTGKEREEEMFSTYHVALSLAVVTVLRALGLEVGRDGGLGSGHCECVAEV
jgi:hypothetical protein